jgi:hypothetical protein
MPLGPTPQTPRPRQTLMHHCEELGELASSLGGRAGEALSDVAAARGAGYAAGRCFYVAHTYLAGGRAPEAAALFGRCAEGRAAEAREKLEVRAGRAGGGGAFGWKESLSGQARPTLQRRAPTQASRPLAHLSLPPNPHPPCRTCPRLRPPRAPRCRVSRRSPTRRARGASSRRPRRRPRQRRRARRRARASRGSASRPAPRPAARCVAGGLGARGTGR